MSLCVLSWQGTGPSAEDHISYTGEGAAGWLYAAAVYARQLPPAELAAAVRAAARRRRRRDCERDAVVAALKAA